MIITVTEHTELVDLEIEGHGKTERITWPEAMELLDRAYTEEIAGTAALIDTYIKTAQAGIVQTANALDGMKELKRSLEERHLIQKPEGGEHGNDSRLQGLPGTKTGLLGQLPAVHRGEGSDAGTEACGEEATV